jgi:hypothetical protein
MKSYECYPRITEIRIFIDILYCTEVIFLTCFPGDLYAGDKAPNKGCLLATLDSVFLLSHQ